VWLAWCKASDCIERILLYHERFTMLVEIQELDKFQGTPDFFP